MHIKVQKKNFYYWQKKLRAKLIEATAPQLVQLEPVSVLADLLQINFRGAELKLPVGVDMDAVSGILDTTGKQCIRNTDAKSPHFSASGNEVFLLVEALPQAPMNAVLRAAAAQFFESLFDHLFQSTRNA